MSRGPIVALLILAGFGGWWYFDLAEKEATRQRLELERQQLEARRLQHQDPLMRLAGCMANHASEVSQMGAARAINTLRSGKSIQGEDYKEMVKMRDALLGECKASHGRDVSASYPNLTEPQLNSAFLKVMAQDPQVVEYLDTFKAISDVERQVYVK